MADVKWIKITTDIFDDDKVLMIEALPSADSIIVIWFKLLTFAGKQNNDGVFIMSNRIAYTDEMLASIFRRDVNTVRFALETFQRYGMIEIIDNVITIPNWNKHQTLDSYERKKERDRLYQAERRLKQRNLIEESSDNRLTSNDKSLPVVVSEEDIEEKDKDKRKRYTRKKTTEDSIEIFERLRDDYNFDIDVEDKLREWIDYKTERKESYQEQGMKTLLRIIETNALKYGSEAICELIDDSMSNGWKGIIFDRLNNKQEKAVKSSTESYIDMWRNA